MIAIEQKKLEQVLDVLIYASSYCDTYGEIEVVKEALAQPEQSWSWVCNECGAREFTSAVSEADLEYLACAGCGCSEFHKEALAQPDYRAVKTYHEGKPVYVSQPEQEPVLLNGLTEAETNSSASVMGLIKHMQPEQEPVAEVKAKQDGYGGTFIQQYQLLEHGTKLYTTPPPCKPKTEKLIKHAWANSSPNIDFNEFLTLFRAIEAAHGIKENT